MLSTFTGKPVALPMAYQALVPMMPGGGMTDVSFELSQ